MFASGKECRHLGSDSGGVPPKAVERRARPHLRMSRHGQATSNRCLNAQGSRRSRMENWVPGLGVGCVLNRPPWLAMCGNLDGFHSENSSSRIKLLHHVHLLHVQQTRYPWNPPQP